MTMTQPATHLGSCLCGAVRFQVEGDFERFYLCHCSRCRKGSGSAHGANLFSTTARLTWLSGKDDVTDFRMSTSRHSHCFCRVCGSALPYERNGGALVVVPAGSLDSSVDIRPTGHIFTASRADWDRDLASLPSFAELPT